MLVTHVSNMTVTQSELRVGSGCVIGNLSMPWFACEWFAAVYYTAGQSGCASALCYSTLFACAFPALYTVAVVVVAGSRSTAVVGLLDIRYHLMCLPAYVFHSFAIQQPVGVPSTVCICC
jgi:hypothetical protein